ncbi:MULTISPECIES: cell division protein FtsA [unclassified Acinetobacter]|uniref:cell division protein FtsA n=1 Tax=unclassified Acinetobacter TaxID=196816 RepID=UPI0035B72DF2
MSDDNIEQIAVIDIGAHKVSLMIGKVHSPDHIEVIVAKHASNHGMTNGKISSLEKVSAAVKSVVQDAEEQTNMRINAAHIAISSPDLFSEIVTGKTKINNPDGTVDNNALIHVLDDAKLKAQNQEDYLVKAIPLGYAIDGSNEWVENPHDLSAQSMTATYQLLKFPVSTMNNIGKVLASANVQMQDVYPSVIAMAEASLLQNERHFGVCMIEIGACTSSISLYLKDNKLAYVKSFAIGSDLVTQEIATMWRTSREEAERIKTIHGSVDIENTPSDQFISVNSNTGMHHYGRKELAALITAVYDRILDVLTAELIESGMIAQASQGIVLTGQGVRIDGMVNLVRKKFNVSVHLANAPTYLTAEDPALLDKIASPIFTATSGLLLLSQQDKQAMGLVEEQPDLTFSERMSNMWENFFRFLKSGMMGGGK